jgi:hypothetical protein
MNPQLSPAYLTIVAASFLTSDYILYRQKFQNIHSRVWIHVLGDNRISPAAQAGERK